MLVKKMLKNLGYLSMIGLFVVNFLVLTTNDTKARPVMDEWGCTYVGSSISLFMMDNVTYCMVISTWDCPDFGQERRHTGNC